MGNFFPAIVQEESGALFHDIKAQIHENNTAWS